MARVYANVAYGPTQKEQANIYEPEDYNFANQTGPDPKGVILYIHGGGWNGGDKDITLANAACFGAAGATEKDLPTYQSALMADDGFLVVDTNYSLLGPDPVPDPYPCLAPRGYGFYPNNINEIAELVKFLAIEGYATGPNQATWQTMQRYVASYGLFVTGTSAGGQLSVAGAFAAASTTGYWPRGMLNVVGPMNLQDSPTNPLTPEAIALVDNYCQSNPASIAGASPYLQRTNYTSYPNWDKLSDPLEYQTKTWIGNWYNTNDNLVPQTAIVPFAEWLASNLGPGFTLTTQVTQGNPVPGPPNHWITSSISETTLPTANRVFYFGVNYPNVQQKVNPEQGMVYPRPYIYRTPRVPS